MEISGVGFSAPSRKYLKIWPRRVQKDTGSEKRKQLVSFPAHAGIYTPLRVAHCLAFLKGRKFLSEIFELLNLADKHFLCWRKNWEGIIKKRN